MPERGYPSVLRLAPAGALVVGMRVADEDIVLKVRYVGYSRLPRWPFSASISERLDGFAACSTARASAPRGGSDLPWVGPANIPRILRVCVYALVQVEPNNAPRIVASVGNLTEV